MQKLLIATTNKGKIFELKNFLSDIPVNCVSLIDAGVYGDVEENGNTYEENSQLKACYFAKKSGLPALADDGGLEIDALGGAPGVRSRRWLGYEATDEELMDHLQKVSLSLPDDNRNASFKVVLSFALPDGEVWSVAGEVRGVIAKYPFTKELAGYPYRSFFFLPELKKFYFESELTSEEMEHWNHRFIAVKKIKPIIMKKLSLKVSG